MARVAIVTGGTRGIGEAISVALKNMGMKVAANYAGNDDRAREFTERTGIAAYKWDVSDHALTLDPALGRIGIGIDKDVTVVERSDQLDRLAEQHAFGVRRLQYRAKRLAAARLAPARHTRWDIQKSCPRARIPQISVSGPVSTETVAKPLSIISEWSGQTAGLRTDLRGPSCADRGPRLRKSQAALAQLVEHIIRNDGVRCSSHLSGTTLVFSP